MSFSSRIETIMSHYGLSPKDLATKLDVQRSSISHIVNGRNKPSVAFITKLSEAFPDLNPLWILHGKQSMITDVNNHTEETVESFKKRDFRALIPDLTEDTSVTTTSQNENKASTNTSTKKRIVRIVNFYSDGTFDVYSPSSE